MKLTATYVKLGDVIVVYCRGQIIFGDEVEELSKEIISQIHSTDRQLVLHLGGIEGLRRGDLGSLWLLYMAARASQWTIKFCNLSVDLRTLLRSTGIEHVFDIYDGEEQAVASFGQTYSSDPQDNPDAMLAKAS